MSLPNPKWTEAGPQVILKSDFIEIEQEVLFQAGVRLQPSLIWVDGDQVKIAATADCPVATQLTGMPNVINPVAQVSGSLSDGGVRTVVADTYCDLSVDGLYGTTQTRKVSQWYAIFAVADDDDTVFTLTAIPIMRVKSQDGQIISLGTTITPATGIGYKFTTDELVGGKVYFWKGASRGLMRSITANNNDDTTGGTITYSGTALSVTAGDWFIVLPPGTNFRLIGTVYNHSDNDLLQFDKIGNKVFWREIINTSCLFAGSVIEAPWGMCPLATRIDVQSGTSTAVSIAHKDFYAYPNLIPWQQVSWCPVEFCTFYAKSWSDIEDPGIIGFMGYEYPANCGF